MPALTSSNFNTPLFLADALTHMEDALRTVGYINRQIEQARNEFARGTVINMKRPATFEIRTTPYTTFADVEQAVPEDIQMTVDFYRTAGMRMTDIEQATVGENANQMHARRIGYTLAQEVEEEVLKLFDRVPHTIQQPLSTADEDVLIDTNMIFQELGVPEDGAQLRRFASNPRLWKKFLGAQAFSQFQGAGTAGVATQQTGDLPEKFGLVPYSSNQLQLKATDANLPTGGTETAAAPAGADIVGGAAKGSRTAILSYTGLAAPTTFSAGQVVQLATAGEGLLAPTAGKAYRRQLYCVESATAVVAEETTVTFTQALRQAHAGTFRRIIQATADAPVAQCGGYYRDAFALAMVALPGNKPGTNVYTAQNPNSGLTMRAREVYDGITMNNALIFDIWFGVKCLDPDKAVRASINLAA